MHHHKVHQDFFSTRYHQEICLAGITIVPLKAIRGVSYLVRSFGISLSPQYRLGYMISVPLPLSNITLLKLKPEMWSSPTLILLLGLAPISDLTEGASLNTLDATWLGLLMSLTTCITYMMLRGVAML